MISNLIDRRMYANDDRSAAAEGRDDDVKRFGIR